MFPYNGPLTTTVGYRYFGAEVHVRSCMPHAFAQRHIASILDFLLHKCYLLYAFVQRHIATKAVILNFILHEC